MKAVRFIASGRPPEVVDIPKPVPGPGQVLVRMGGAGVCHSDLHVLDHGFSVPGPFTLGHENAGWIEQLGEGVTGWKEGDPVAVYGPWGCGQCKTCQSSAENYCERHASIPSYGGGLGSDGGMAEYMIVPSARLLVPLGGLDPLAAAPLSDAALTPYHAIKAAMPLLTPDATVLVLGVGGLGHMAVQILRALTSAKVIAGDIDETKLAHARQLGVAHTVNTRNADLAGRWNTVAQAYQDHGGRWGQGGTLGPQGQHHRVGVKAASAREHHLSGGARRRGDGDGLVSHQSQALPGDLVRTDLQQFL